MAEQAFSGLRGKFQPLVEEILRNGGRVEMVELRANKLFLRAEVASPDDYDRVWDRIRQLDPDLKELEPVVTIREGTSLRPERPTGKAEIGRAADEGHRGAGDRRRPSGPTT